MVHFICRLIQHRPNTSRKWSAGQGLKTNAVHVRAKWGGGGGGVARAEPNIGMHGAPTAMHVETDRYPKPI
jgi:hypothetical protein